MNKVVIVTGGTSGIGFEVAKKYLNEGNIIVVASLDKQDIIETSMKKFKEIGKAVFYKCNVACLEECQAVVNETIRNFGKVDVLVNVAGVTGKRVKFIEADLNDFKNTIQINLMGSINMAQCVAKEMVKNKSGVIINVGSICGFLANSESVGYHASKGGIKMVTQALAKELSPDGIRVVSVAPGWVKTAMVDETTEQLGSVLHLKQRVIEPFEVANAIYLLSLDEASAINGTTVMVDDGYSSFKSTFDKTDI